MKLKQLSLFVENKSGSLHSACRILAENNISIRTLSLADTEQFGILRLLVKEWESAAKVLEDNNFVVKITDVIALKVQDRPGGLAELLAVLDEHKINVEYMYAFTFGTPDSAIIIFRFDEVDEALKVLHSEGIDTVGNFEIFK